jgi:nitroreductase
MAAPMASCAEWREILTLARYAPSPHNVQPWRLRLVSDREAELFIDGRRTLPKEDTTGSFLLSAMGMFLEAMDIIAGGRGLRLHYQLEESADWFAAKARAEPVGEMIRFARLRLAKGEAVPGEFAPDLFLKRRTCRIPLHAMPVTDEAMASLQGLAARWDQQYGQIVDQEQIERILARNIDAVFHDLNVADYHDEITSWFRFTDREAERHRDGLDWRCMNVSRSEFWLSARLSRLLLFGPTRAFLKKRYRRQLGAVPAMGMLSGPFFVAEKALESGRFLMRFWLEVTRLGLYLHPYGNMVTNVEAAEWLKQLTGVDHVWLVFKLGYADEPPLSHRRSVEEILIG